jgi:hypothetical protein
MRSFELAGFAAGLLLSMTGRASAYSYDGDCPTTLGASIRTEDITESSSYIGWPYFATGSARSPVGRRARAACLKLGPEAYQ